MQQTRMQILSRALVKRRGARSCWGNVGRGLCARDTPPCLGCRGVRFSLQVVGKRLDTPSWPQGRCSMLRCDLLHQVLGCACRFQRLTSVRLSCLDRGKYRAIDDPKVPIHEFRNQDLLAK